MGEFKTSVYVCVCAYRNTLLTYHSNVESGGITSRCLRNLSCREI